MVRHQPRTVALATGDLWFSLIFLFRATRILLVPSGSRRREALRSEIKLPHNTYKILPQDVQAEHPCPTTFHSICSIQRTLQLPALAAMPTNPCMWLQSIPSSIILLLRVIVSLVITTDVPSNADAWECRLKGGVPGLEDGLPMSKLVGCYNACKRGYAVLHGMTGQEALQAALDMNVQTAIERTIGGNTGIRLDLGPALVRSGFDCPYVSVALFQEIRQLTHLFLNQVRTLPPSYRSLTLPAVAPELGQFLAFIVWNLFIWFDSLVSASSSFRLRCRQVSPTLEREEPRPVGHWP